MTINNKIRLAALIILALSIVSVMAAKKDKDSKSADQPAKTEQADVKSTTQPAALDSFSVNSPDTVLVKVDSQPITQADLDAEMAQIHQMMKNRGAPPIRIESMLATIKPQVLEGLIVRKLITKECTKEKITVSPEEINKEIESFKASLPKQRSLDDFLKQSKIDRATFEKDVGEQVKVQKLLKITLPTDDEVKAFYEKNKMMYEVPETVSARHILIASNSTDDEAKKKANKKKAEDIRAKLVKGEDFEKLARENSACPSKENGGKLGDFPRGQMVPAFEEAAFSLKTNEISKVVETEFGYHVIQTTGRNPARTIPFDEVKGQIAFRLKSKTIQEQAEILIVKLKEKAKIEYEKAGEALKPAPMPEGGMPLMMPSGDKDAGKEKPAKDSEKKDKGK